MNKAKESVAFALAIKDFFCGGLFCIFLLVVSWITANRRGEGMVLKKSK